jgi:UDP:flavonoid glycosyltransferase YjiC (YdhE family)
MKVVFTCAPAYGHLNPLLPLARAFGQSGDEVVLATSADMCARAEAAGVRTTVVGPGMDVWGPELARRAGGQPGDGLPADRILPYFIPRLFAEIGAQLMIDDLVSTVGGADLVVFESFAFAGPLAAAVAGIPAVHFLLGPPPPLEAMTLAGDAISPLWRKWHVEPRPFGGVYAGPSLNICPPALGVGDIPAGAALMPLSPVIIDAADGDRLPEWIDELPDRPTVYMTLGTVTNSDQGVFAAALEGLRDSQLNLIITVGPNGNPEGLGPLPANTRAERYIPQSLLLPRCHAVVSHGGSGTMLATLRCGLPQVMIPQGADQYINSSLCVAAGVADRLLPDELNPTTIRERVDGVLRHQRMQAAAARIRSEIESMPPPDEVVRSLHHLVDRAA